MFSKEDVVRERGRRKLYDRDKLGSTGEKIFEL